MNGTVITEPAGRLINLSLAKAQTRIDTNDEDQLVAHWLQAAQGWCESWTGIRFMRQVREYTFDGFPTDDSWLLPIGAANAISQIQYDDEDGVEQAFTAYSATFARLYLELKAHDAWPDTSEQLGSVRIQIDEGYDTTPADLVTAVLSAFAHIERNRGGFGDMPDGVISLLTPYRAGFRG